MSLPLVRVVDGCPTEGRSLLESASSALTSTFWLLNHTETQHLEEEQGRAEFLTMLLLSFLTQLCMRRSTAG